MKRKQFDSKTHHTSKKKKTSDKKRVSLLWSCGFLFLPMLALLLFLLFQRFSKSTDTQPLSVTVSTESTTTASSATISPSTSTTTSTTTTATKAAVAAPLPEAASIAVTPIEQLPELPTGCEVTTLTTLLQYLGYDVEKTTLADRFLPCAAPGEAAFWESFIGSPYSETGYGCYAPVIVTTARAFLQSRGSSYEVKNLTGTKFDQLLSYVAEGTPVMVWTSMSQVDLQLCYAYTIRDYAAIAETLWMPEESAAAMKKLKFSWDGMSEAEPWTIRRMRSRLTEATPYGVELSWLVNEHCVLLTGYDEWNVTVCDPLKGVVTYERERFAEIYEELFRQAVIIQAEPA